MPELQIQIDNQINQALESIRDVKKPNYKQLARKKNLPYQRLLARSKGRTTRSQRPSGTYKLSEAQDSALYNYIARLDELGICIRLLIIVACANYLLQRSHDGLGPPPLANPRWAKRWLKRNPKFYLRC